MKPIKKPLTTGLIYFRFLLERRKTYLERFKEHLDGKGGVLIKRLIEDGALKEDFQVELLGIYPKKECLSRETELAKTSLFPKGLNGNAGKYVNHTEEVKGKMSKAARKRVENRDP